ncbi:unannotated protein [freshwater metagenome]|uniref:Unannotated protein n=1 Tax=freshwater metagenome TaxID=449393 RepID=A0A6J7LC67_9ZZZZ
MPRVTTTAITTRMSLSAVTKTSPKTLTRLTGRALLIDLGTEV